MQVDPIKPMSKPPGTKRLKLEYGKLLSKMAFNFNLRRNTEEVRRLQARLHATEVRRCRLTLSNPR